MHIFGLLSLKQSIILKDTVTSLYLHLPSIPMIVIHSSIVHLYLTGLRSTRSSSNQLIDRPKHSATQKNTRTARNNHDDSNSRRKKKLTNPTHPQHTYTSN